MIKIKSVSQSNPQLVSAAAAVPGLDPTQCDLSSCLSSVKDYVPRAV